MALIEKPADIERLFRDAPGRHEDIGSAFALDHVVETLGQDPKFNDMAVATAYVTDEMSELLQDICVRVQAASERRQPTDEIKTELAWFKDSFDGMGLLLKHLRDAPSTERALFNYEFERLGDENPFGTDDDSLDAVAPRRLLPHIDIDAASKTVVDFLLGGPSKDKKEIPKISQADRAHEFLANPVGYGIVVGEAAAKQALSMVSTEAFATWANTAVAASVVVGSLAMPSVDRQSPVGKQVSPTTDPVSQFIDQVRESDDIVTPITAGNEVASEGLIVIEAQPGMDVVQSIVNTTGREEADVLADLELLNGKTEFEPGEKIVLPMTQDEAADIVKRIDDKAGANVDMPEPDAAEEAVAGETASPSEVATVETTPEQASPEVAVTVQAWVQRILEHPNVLIEAGRVRQSIEDILDDGRTFTHDVSNDNVNEVPVTPLLLQAIVELADNGHFLTITSLTTGDHAETSNHYRGLAIDIQPASQDEFQAVFQYLYDNRDRLVLNELIYGGTLPANTTNLKHGEWKDYDRKDVLDEHLNHIHFSVGATEEHYPVDPYEVMYQPTPSIQELLEQQREEIEFLRPAYEAAAQATGLDWRVIAAIDYREASNDPTRSAWAGEPLGGTNPDWSDVKPTDKTENLISAANHLKNMVRQVYGIELGRDTSFEQLALAALSYNRGSMYVNAGESVMNSPYVFDGIDAGHTWMNWPNNAAEPAGTRGRQHRHIGFIPMLLWLERTYPS